MTRRLALGLGAAAALLIVGEPPAVGSRAPAHLRRGRAAAADDPVRGRRHARREPAAAEPDRLDSARDRGDRELRRRRRLLRRPRVPHRPSQPSALAARRLPDPGVGVDARSAASADPLLPRRQDLAALALDALGVHRAHRRADRLTSRSRISAPSPTTRSRIDSSGELKQLGGNGGNAAGFVFVVLLFFAISLSWVVRQVVALPPLDAATGDSS